MRYITALLLYLTAANAAFAGAMQPTVERPGWPDCHIPIRIDPLRGWRGDPAHLLRTLYAAYGSAGLTFDIVDALPPDGPAVIVVPSGSPGGWCGIGGGTGNVLCGLPDDNSRVQERIWLHEIGHALSLRHGHQHPAALLFVRYIDYRAIGWEQIQQWMPHWSGYLAPIDSDPLDSVMAYWSPGVIGYQNQRYATTVTDGDRAVLTRLCATWRAQTLPDAIERPDTAGRFAVWDVETDIVTLTIPGGQRVRAGYADGRLTADTDWHLRPVYDLGGWHHDGERWTASFTLDAAADVLGSGPDTGHWLAWTGTDARAEPTISLFVRIEPCAVAGIERACFRVVRGYPLVNRTADVRMIYTQDALTRLTGPLGADRIFADGFGG